MPLKQGIATLYLHLVVALQTLGLVDEVVRDIPKEHIAIIGARDQPILPIIDILLNLLLRRQLLQQRRLRLRGHRVVTAVFAAYCQSLHGFFVYLLEFNPSLIVHLLAPPDCLLDLVLDALYRLLLLRGLLFFEEFLKKKAGQKKKMF